MQGPSHKTVTTNIPGFENRDPLKSNYASRLGSWDRLIWPKLFALFLNHPMKILPYKFQRIQHPLSSVSFWVSYSLMVLLFIEIIIWATENDAKWVPDVCGVVFESGNETTTLSQNVGNWLLADAVSCPVRTGAAAAPLREPKKEQTFPSCVWHYARWHLAFSDYPDLRGFSVLFPQL